MPLQLEHRILYRWCSLDTNLIALLRIRFHFISQKRVYFDDMVVVLYGRIACLNLGWPTGLLVSECIKVQYPKLSVLRLGHCVAGGGCMNRRLFHYN